MNQLDYQTPKEAMPTSDDRGSLQTVAKCHMLFGALGCIGGIMVWFNFHSDPAMRGLPQLLLIAFGLFFSSGLCMIWHRAWIFSIAVGSLTCLLFPVGTILGAMTIRVLCRPGVQAIYR